MRLLNVFTGKLEEYFGRDIPRYAILSHTWGRDEITFSDIQNLQDRSRAGGTGRLREKPLVELSMAAPAPQKEEEAGGQEITSPPNLPLGEKDLTEMETCNAIKSLYFEQTAVLEQLRAELEKRSWDINQLNELRRVDPEPIVLVEELTDFNRLLFTYERLERLYFETQDQIDFLQKVVTSWATRWASSLSREDPSSPEYPLSHMKLGFQKIIWASKQTIADGYEYAWIDTCCIDKSSSAELSEAINSMFQWYQGAGVCYAYVEDVLLENFGTGRWFTRGWTLQELLAPNEVIFYGVGWTRLGTKVKLADQITEVTGIHKDALLEPFRLNQKSIAQRMSWASKRETTRLEDAAYCLLGIFGVNMPLLYGEGKKAFFRLQEEILKSSVDQSLFAWSMSQYEFRDQNRGIFAQSPVDYQASYLVVPFQRTKGTAPYAMTNKGLQIDLPIIEEPGYAIGLLDCQFQDEVSTCLAIVLLPTNTPDVYLRIHGAAVSETEIEIRGIRRGGLRFITHEQSSKARIRKIYIPREEYEIPSERTTYLIEFPMLRELGFKLLPKWSSLGQLGARWDDQAQSLHIVRSFRSISSSVVFVFHNAERKVAFAIYVEENLLTGIEEVQRDGIPIEEKSIDLWLSPLASELEPGFHSNSSYGAEDWLYALSHGIDHHGVERIQHRAIRFSHIDKKEGIIITYAISAHLKIANHFGQKVRQVYVSCVDPKNVSERPQSEASQNSSGTN